MYINVPHATRESRWELWLAGLQNTTEVMKIYEGNHEVKHENYIPYHSPE